MTLDQIKTEFRLHYDEGDPWGSAMQWAFAIAEESYFNRNGDAAMLLEYSPGCGVPNLTENICYEELAELSDSDLMTFAGLMYRFLEMCKRKSLDY